MEGETIKERVTNLEKDLFQIKNNANQVTKRVRLLEDTAKAHSETLTKIVQVQGASESDIKLLRQAVPIALVIGCVLGTIIARIL